MRTKTIKITVLLLAAFLIVSCGGGTSNVKSFYYKLQGTWESNDKTRYSGTVVIGYDRITITGYDANQTPRYGDDNERPFRQLPKGRAMKGYSEEYKEDGKLFGKIFIDNGNVTEIIDYTFWDDNPPPTYNLTQYLRFNFGGRTEDMDYKGQ